MICTSNAWPFYTKNVTLATSSRGRTAVVHLVADERARMSRYGMFGSRNHVSGVCISTVKLPVLRAQYLLDHSMVQEVCACVNSSRLLIMLWHHGIRTRVRPGCAGSVHAAGQGASKLDGH